MTGFAEIFADEWRQIPRRLGGTVGLLALAGIAVFLGYMVPRMWGYQFLNPRIILIYAALAMVFVLPQAPPAIARSITSSASPWVVAAGKLAAVVSYAWGAAMLMLALGLAGLNIIRGAWGKLMPPLDFLAAVALLSLLLTVFVAVFAMLLTMQLGNADIVKRALRIGMFAVILGLLFAVRSGSGAWYSWLTLAALTGEFSTVAFTFAPALVLLDLVLLRLVVRALSGGTR